MPGFTSIGTRAQSASAATLTPSKPSVLGQNGVMLAVLYSKNNATHSTVTAGWVQVGAQINSGASFTASLWIAPEGSAAPVFTWTGAAACAARVAYYADAENVVEATIGNITSNAGSGATHSTSAINSSRDLSLIAYIDVAAANTAMATPAGWTEDADSGSATDAGRTVFGSKAIPTSGSSSGAISVTGANADWVQWQVELRVQLATGFEASKEELAAWLEPVPGFAASKLDFYAWIEPGTYPSPGGGRRRRPVIN